MEQFRLAHAVGIDSLKGMHHVQVDKFRSTSKFLLQKNAEMSKRNQKSMR